MIKKRLNGLYIIKNILFLAFLYSLVRILPNLFDIGITGIIFLILTIIYLIFEFLAFLVNDKLIKNSEIINIICILLYVYVSLIAYRYLDSHDSLDFIVDPLYFQINYSLAAVGMISIIVHIYNKIKDLDKKVSN